MFTIKKKCSDTSVLSTYISAEDSAGDEFE